MHNQQAQQAQQAQQRNTESEHTMKAKNYNAGLTSAEYAQAASEGYRMQCTARRNKNVVQIRHSVADVWKDKDSHHYDSINKAKQACHNGTYEGHKVYTVR